MKTTAILVLLVFATFTASMAQEETKKSKKEQKKEERAAKKAARKAAQEEAVLKSNALIQSKFWVLEATTLQDKGGSLTTNLDPNLNFVIVEQDKGIIQLGFNGVIGWNGAGGVTFQGDITSYKIKPGRKSGDPAMLTARFTGLRVNYQLRLTVSGEYGEVLLTNTFSNDRITFIGKLVHPNESTVYRAPKTN